MWTALRHLPFAHAGCSNFRKTRRCVQRQCENRRNKNAESVVLTFLAVFFRRRLRLGDDERMLSRAPPRTVSTCFNIHDITSSLGGQGVHGDEAAHSGLLSLEHGTLALSTVIG